MYLTNEPKATLAICLNPAWQKMLKFSHLTHGEVNRARELRECGGGKGINVARVYRLFGWPVVLAGFVGGSTGAKLREELAANGTIPLLQETAGATRCCCTVISEDNGEITELIEPSAHVTAEECLALLKATRKAVSDAGVVVFSGSVPPGVEPSFCEAVAQECALHSVPFVLDAVSGLEGALAAGVTVLKINAAELRKITGKEDILVAGKALLSQYSRLGAVAITDGPRPGFLFLREGTWEFAVPHLEHVVNPIGGGDCATSILARRIAEGAAGEGLAEAFAEALSCSCASCLTDTPSVFDWKAAQEIRSRLTFRKLT
ncbi:MAG: hypothetical protein IJJ26_07615 [Victivallales bacterium]|nr:hypothetical protein [Victivallales bacterium]